MYNFLIHTPHNSFYTIDHNASVYLKEKKKREAKPLSSLLLRIKLQFLEKGRIVLGQPKTSSPIFWQTPAADTKGRVRIGQRHSDTSQVCFPSLWRCVDNRLLNLVIVSFGFSSLWTYLPGIYPVVCYPE